MPFQRLLPIYLAAMISPIGGVGVITLLPVLSESWNISIQWVSLTITLYMVPYVIFQLFSGSIAQVFDTRRTLLFGFGVYSLGGFLCGFSPNLAFLICARLIQGFGAAFIAPIVMALVGEMVRPEHLGKAMGILGATYTIGVTMGPLISGFLEVHLGWPWFFFFLATLGTSVGAFYWLTSGGTPGAERGAGKISDALQFVRRSFSYPNVRYLSYAAFSLFLGYIGLMTFKADYLRNFFSLPSDKVGFVLSTTGFSGVLVSPIAGFLGDRIGRKSVVCGGAVIMASSILCMEAAEYTYERYLLFFALFGSGAATMWTSLNTLAVQAVPDLRKPVASLYNSFKFTGYALSPLLLSFLYVPFSISAVRWACLACISVSLLFTSRLREFTE